jgi:hypothetical protein
MRNLLLLFVILIFTPCLAVHNFTINDSATPSVSVGDTLHIYFEFESAGSAADYSVTLSMIVLEVPLLSSDNQPLADGGAMDLTGVDGVFEADLPMSASFPEEATLSITMTDQGVSDTVEMQSIPLESTFSISGSVTEEGDWIDLPVPYALVWTFYNASIEDVAALIANASPEAILEYMSQNHYLISDATGLTGNYQLMIPDDIPNVNCTVGVYSAVDLAGGYVAPDLQMITVNGAVTGIDFLYQEPDGTLAGTITDGTGEPVGNAFLLISNTADSLDTSFALSDSLGAYSFSLMAGTYTLIVAATGFDPYLQTVEFTGGNVTLDIALSTSVTGGVSGIVTDQDGQPVSGAAILATNLSEPDLSGLTNSGADGGYSLALSNGAYHYTATKPGFGAAEGDFVIANNQLTVDITLQLVGAVEQAAPLDVTSLSVSPNPFNPTANIVFQLDKPENVRIEVFNTRGQRMAVLANGFFTAGRHHTVWNGIAENGSKASSGVYITRMMAGGKAFVQKTLMLK